MVELVDGGSVIYGYTPSSLVSISSSGSQKHEVRIGVMLFGQPTKGKLNGGPGGLDNVFEDLEGGEGPEDDDCEDADEDEAGHAENDATSCREEDDRCRKERKTIFPAALRRTHSLEV